MPAAPRSAVIETAAKFNFRRLAYWRELWESVAAGLPPPNEDK